MNALAHLGDRIEFVYTNISPQLVSYGRKTYGPKYPFATFHLLDIEMDTEEQVRFLAAAQMTRLLTVRLAGSMPISDQD